MKLKQTILKGGLIALFLALSGLVFAASSKTGTILNRACPVSFNTDAFDVGSFENFSVQAAWSDANPSTSTISNGSKSTNAITVNDYAKLSEKKAFASITISSNTTTALSGSSITIHGVSFLEGRDWNRGATLLLSAKSLSNAIEAHPSFTSTHTLAGTAIVYASAPVTGVAYNGWSIESSTPAAMTLSGSSLQDGQDNAYIFINGTTLTQGTDWTAAASNATTAENIENAIVANSALSAVITATHPTTTAVVYATSVVNGINAYPISLSTSALSFTFPYFSGGTASDISVSGDSFYEPSHGFQTGLQVQFSTAINQLPPTGLVGRTTYYVIRTDDNYYKLAGSAALAAAGTPVDITALYDATATYTMGVIRITTGTAGFTFQVSNDNTNWTEHRLTSTDLSLTSVTVGATHTNKVWQFVDPSYHYIRLAVTGPTAGAIGLNVTINGKEGD